MNDSKNNNTSQPFTETPFSVDVWERAYQNVGRPFEKKPFDSGATPVDTQNADSLPKKVISDDEARKAALKEKKEALKKRQAEKATQRSSEASPSITPPKGSLASQPSPEKIYTTAYASDENYEGQKGFFEILEDIFDGDISDVKNKIKDIIKNPNVKNSDAFSTLKTIVGVIALILFIILITFGAA